MNTNQIIKEEKKEEEEEKKEEEEQEESYFCNKCEIIECRGTKCRLHHSDGYGIHCISCYSPTHENTLVEKPDVDTIKIIECSGSKCRRHILDRTGIQCISCFEKWEILEKY